MVLSYRARSAVLFFGLLIAAAVLGAQAKADEVKVFGAGSGGQFFELNPSGGLPQICIYPGQQIRVVADWIGFQGQRQFVPREAFSWQMRTPDGRYVIWDPQLSSMYFPFFADSAFSAVRVQYPHNAGPWATVEAVSRSGLLYRFALVNAADGRASCQWSYPEAYIQPGQPIPPN